MNEVGQLGKGAPAAILVVPSSFCVIPLGDHIKVMATVGVNGLQLTSP